MFRSPAKEDVLVVVERSDPTVNCDVVEMRAEPSELEVMIELAAKDVEFVPPLATVSVPEMFDSVEVAIHVGTPFDRARTCPSVPDEVVESL